jgi:hypothetical protein
LEETTSHFFLIECLDSSCEVTSGVSRTDKAKYLTDSIFEASLQLGANENKQERLIKLEPKSNGWDVLELPDGHKTIVQSLVNSHFVGKGHHTL